MRILFLSLQAFLIFNIIAADEPVQSIGTRLPVQRPENNKHDNSMDLLSTLKELHESLIKQIALLENMQNNSDMVHLVLHYTAQRDNVEREIALLKSIETESLKDTSPRQVYKSISEEERFFQNIFKNTKNPSSTDQANDVDKYALTYPSYYDQLLYSYQEPQRPVHPYPNDLIADTFPGYQPPHNYHQQMFTGHPQVYHGSMSTVPQPNVGVFPHPPHATLQAQIPPSRLMPELPSNTKEPQRHPKPQHLPRPTPSRSKNNTESQITQSNKIQSQPTTSRPFKTTTRLPSFGQKQEITIYYPDNIVIEDDNQHQRPTIVDRFGQAFDRFGQVISNLANRQALRPLPENDANVPHKTESIPTRSRLRDSTSYPMSFTKNEMKMEAKSATNKRQNLRWVSV